MGMPTCAGLARDRHDVRVIVLRSILDEEEVARAVEKKKSKPFSALFGPGKDEIHVHSIKLYHECMLRASGKYVADYYRQATHAVSVDSNVHEVALGGETFPVRKKSRLERVFVGKKGRNKVDLKMEEHVFVERESEVIFDHHGKPSKFPYKLGPGKVENYPKKILDDESTRVRKSEMSVETMIKRLKSELKDGMAEGVRDLTEEFTVTDLSEVYVPVYEARLVAPDKKVGILRIDAARNRTV